MLEKEKHVDSYLEISNQSLTKDYLKVPSWSFCTFCILSTLPNTFCTFWKKKILIQSTKYKYFKKIIVKMLLLLFFCMMGLEELLYCYQNQGESIFGIPYPYPFYQWLYLLFIHINDRYLTFLDVATRPNVHSINI